MKLTIRDIGVWSHYVGDASQPLHVSVHFKIHAYFEGEFVRHNLSRAAVAAEVGPYQPCNCPIAIEQETRALLLATLVQVEPLYQLEKEGAFKKGDPRSISWRRPPTPIFCAR